MLDKRCFDADAAGELPSMEYVEPLVQVVWLLQLHEVTNLQISLPNVGVVALFLSQSADLHLLVQVVDLQLDLVVEEGPLACVLDYLGRVLLLLEHDADERIQHVIDVLLAEFEFGLRNRQVQGGLEHRLT